MTCNKENYAQGHGSFQGAPDRDMDDGNLPLSVVNSRRPSISAPISGKKHPISSSSSSSSIGGSRVHTPPPASPRLPAPSDFCADGATSSTPKRRASSSPLTSCSLDDQDDIKPDIKQERIDSSQEEISHASKKSRTEVADAESNTTHSGKFKNLTSFIIKKYEAVQLAVPGEEIFLEWLGISVTTEIDISDIVLFQLSKKSDWVCGGASVRTGGHFESFCGSLGSEVT